MGAFDAQAAKAIIAEHAHLDGAMLPVLHALQHAFGYIDDACVPLIADALNLSRAEVHGTIAFYHDFRAAPAGRRIIKICRAEACQANGCEELLAELKSRRGLTADSASGDRLSIETVYCLGNCALGPAALVDGELVGRLTSDELARLCDGASVEQAQIAAGRKMTGETA
ncbi:MAG: NAD(P)H-dependent oxidoreductase subunit E [Hyphomicrobiales bacterium]|nr:NAD(P)H-dependent oxidoreductase subunit E [Hyphomicrobiales bacterium]